jgi:hypothetical protein
MEITLQGKSIYGIAGWDGKIDIEGLKFFQTKRLAGSRNNASLFRKLVKIFKGEHSPLKLPKELSPEDLDMGDFTQIMIGIAAMSKGRSVRKIYECPHCKKEQPRVLDILKIFIPSKPEIEGGMADVEIAAAAKDKPAEIVICKYLRVKDYIKINDMVDSIKDSLYKTINNKPILDLTTVKETYGKLCDFSDLEDVQDFCELMTDVGLVAMRVNNPKIADENRFMDTMKWLLHLQGEQLEIYSKISSTIMKLSADISNTYESVCNDCKKKFTAELEPTDYFFDLQFPS